MRIVHRKSKVADNSERLCRYFIERTTLILILFWLILELTFSRDPLL